MKSYQDDVSVAPGLRFQPDKGAQLVAFLIVENERLRLLVSTLKAENAQLRKLSQPSGSSKYATLSCLN